ncbi:hypothetical protein FIV42_29250 [Persicimonas caeni]|uniref:Uncharacterized protein n=1 Tax=Persicimonas caeni TaxID=2292766 RepID=A0A4Y6Q2A5_PERCE|nr:hypothetical protein [Persicimonas caeni]QDG54683.1 hypothetical protein FIV42_29250 [Persicimonas caeni]QED35904.1 hypothetical protein FRD00_29245 [Persicimonas caeni]
MKTDAECQRVEAIEPREVMGLPEESQLLIQIIRYVCEVPDATCSGYGQRVLESHLTGHLDQPTFVWSIDDWEIQKVIGDEASAVVYVDLVGAGDTDDIAHETLAMKKVGNVWYVSEQMVNEPRPTAP